MHKFLNNFNYIKFFDIFYNKIKYDLLFSLLSQIINKKSGNPCDKDSEVSAISSFIYVLSSFTTKLASLFCSCW